MNINILFNKNRLEASFETRTEEIVAIYIKSQGNTQEGPCGIRECTTLEELSMSATNGMVCVLHSPDQAVSYESSKKEYSFLCKAFVAKHRCGEGDTPGVLEVENLKALVLLKKQTAFCKLRQWVKRKIWRLLKKKIEIVNVLEVNFIGSSSKNNYLKVQKTDAEHILQHFRLLPFIGPLR